jgi:hypothetical protein
MVQAAKPPQDGLEGIVGRKITRVNLPFVERLPPTGKVPREGVGRGGKEIA